MSVLTPKRVFPVVAALLIASAAFASNPSPRTYARMVYDAQSDATVLFGGRVGTDPATNLAYASSETWTLSGRRWIQQFPAHSPQARSLHAMAYDAKDDRVVLFGGRAEADDPDAVATMLNDTWVWDGNDWTQILTGEAPSPRIYASMAYDSKRDVIVLFGGQQFAADGETLEAVHDTWEFDGSTWTRAGAVGEPKVNGPMVGYDPGRDSTVLLGTDTAGATLMYRYDPATDAWTKLTPTLVPPCAAEGLMTYRARTGRLLFTGGICPSDNSGEVKSYEWDGTTWVDIATTNSPGRAAGQSFAYDSLRDSALMYGGVAFGFTAPRSGLIRLENLTWTYSAVTLRPAPRSLAVLRTDPVNKALWMFGGLDEESSYFMIDFWRYANGQWNWMNVADSPTDCTTPGAAFDTNRNVMVLVCGGNTVYEWDGAVWKKPTPDAPPTDRRWGGVVYDENVKKTVLFGGYDTNANFRNDTWTWDGTKWTEVKENRPTHRAMMAIWYDPLLKKTVMFGGLGRPNNDTKVTRYNDMWSFSGTGWTKMTVSLTPGERFGPATAVNPQTGKVLLFGGLRTEINPQNPLEVKQYYVNDTWQWDGSANSWTKLEPVRRPPARENATMAWDPVSGEMTLFSGFYGGFYFSDVWTWNGQTWTPVEPSTGRRRAVGGE